MRTLQEIINVCKARRTCDECPVSDYCQQVKMMYGVMLPEKLLCERFCYLTDENRKNVLSLEIHIG